MFYFSADLKRLTHEKMKEMDELKRKREHPEAEKYRNVLQKGQSHLEKYQKMATITQNVLRVNCARYIFKNTALYS